MVIVELLQDRSLSFCSPYLDWLQTFSESLLLLFAQINLTETDKRTLKTFHRKIVVRETTLGSHVSFHIIEGISRL